MKKSLIIIAVLSILALLVAFIAAPFALRAGHTSWPLALMACSFMAFLGAFIVFTVKGYEL